MTENECMHGYFEIIRYTCLNSGVPLAAYSDKHTIFRTPLTDKKAEAGEEANLTQFGRALAELGIELIHAHSPQAKGRIERLWATLQSRLPVEFRLRNITTIEQANEFLADIYIPAFNAQFSVPAEKPSIFVPYKHAENIDNILCIKEIRKLDNAGSFSFHGKKFKIIDEGYPIISAKSVIEVLVGTRQSLQVRYKGRIYQTISLSRPEKVAPSRSKKVNPEALQRQLEPHLKHGSEQWKKIWYCEDYNDSHKFLFDLFFKAFAQAILIAGSYQ